MIITFSLSKNSIPTPCKYKEPLDLTQVSQLVHYSTPQWVSDSFILCPSVRNMDTIRILLWSLISWLFLHSKSITILSISQSHNPVGDVNIVQNGQVQLLSSKP